MTSINDARRTLKELLAQEGTTLDQDLLRRYCAAFGIHARLTSLLRSSAPVAEQAIFWELAWRQWPELGQLEPGPRFSNPFFDPRNGHAQELGTVLEGPQSPAVEFLRLCSEIEHSDDWPSATRALEAFGQGMALPRPTAPGEGHALEREEAPILYHTQVISRAVFRGDPEVVSACALLMVRKVGTMVPGVKHREWRQLVIDVLWPFLLLCYSRVRGSAGPLLGDIYQAVDREIYTDVRHDVADLLFQIERLDGLSANGAERKKQAAISYWGIREKWGADWR